MAEFAYNNAKNASTGHTFFELNYGYHLWILYKEDIDPYLKSKLVDKLSIELKKLMIIYRENLYHAQKLQKHAHNKSAKSRSYVSNNKVWLNSKYIKNKQNWKLEAKFFEPFQVLCPIGKQAYKLKLSKKCRIYDIFHMSLLEQDTTRKERVDENVTKLDTGDNKSGEYKVGSIYDSKVYTREPKFGYHLPRLYYLIIWKRYPEKDNTWEPVLAVQHIKKLINSFHKDYPDKPTAILLSINIAPLITKTIIKLANKLVAESAKQNRGWPANSSNKWTIKSWAKFDFYYVFDLFKVWAKFC